VRIAWGSRSVALPERRDFLRSCGFDPARLSGFLILDLYGDGRKVPMVPARVVNHTDTELIMLEALVGRTPPREVMDSTWPRY
jgi:hypothetical protein